MVGFFDQHQAEDLPTDATALEALAERHPDRKEHEIRAHLGAIGLGKLAVQPVGCLSGGERSRVALAAATLQAPHVLVAWLWRSDMRYRSTCSFLCYILYKCKYRVYKTLSVKHVVVYTLYDIYIELSERAQCLRKVLDEPTNHLDLLTVDALSQALKDFEGSIVVTSHDRRLLREVCTAPRRIV